ncbi:MAG: hypothetical protein ACRDPY_17880 [Streptosporangiaceae bacterium]
MPSMTRDDGTGTLAERIAALQAERLAPVPRASHSVGVDAADLALILAHVRASATTLRGKNSPATRMAGDVAAAYGRLVSAARAYAAPGAGPAWPQDRL